jgi:hypothetical protein
MLDQEQAQKCTVVASSEPPADSDTQATEMTDSISGAQIKDPNVPEQKKEPSAEEMKEVFTSKKRSKSRKEI